MALPFELKIALRYLRAKRKAGVSVTGLLTVAGVTVGVWALTVVTSVWNGFETEFLDKLLGVNAHAVVLKRHDVFRSYQAVAAQLQADPRVELATPFVYTEVIAQSPRGVQGVAYKGIDPKAALDLPLAKYVGDDAPQVFETLAARSSSVARAAGARPGVIIGRELQAILHVEPGDEISIISPYGGRDGEARTTALEVVGIFHSGMFEFDSRMVFVALREAQRFLRLYDTVTGLEVWSEDPLESYELLHAAVTDLSDDPFAYEVRDWSRTNAGIFGAVRSQKAIISIFLFLIVIVAAFNIMATLILLILEKGREIAVLQSLGAPPRSILTVFVIDGQLVGLVGCAAGVGLGLLTCAVLEQYGLRLDPRVYYLERLPIVVSPIEIAVVVGGAMVLATLATLFPALRAAGTSPVDGLTRRAVRGGGPPEGSEAPS